MSVNEVRVSISARDAAAKIKAHMEGSISSALLDYAERAAEGKTAIVMVFEKFYYRAGNRLVLTVLIDDFAGATRVRSVGGGGGEGVFIRFDWGAGRSYSNSAIEAVRAYIIGG